MRWRRGGRREGGGGSVGGGVVEDYDGEQRVTAMSMSMVPERDGPGKERVGGMCGTCGEWGVGSGVENVGG